MRDLKYLTRERRLLAAVALAVLGESLAGGALTLAGLDLRGQLAATSDEFAWLDIAYNALKMFGFLATPCLFARFSPLRCFRLAIWLLVGSAVLTAVWVGLWPLVLLRALMGLAAGAILVGGQALLFAAIPPKRQLMAQSIYALGVVMGSAFLAPAIQGFLVDRHSFSPIFSLTAALGLMALALAKPLDPSLAPRSGAIRQDFSGALALLVFLVSLNYVLTLGERWNWGETPLIVGLTVLSLVAFGLFVFKEIVSGGKGLRPMIDGRAFNNEAFAFGLPLAAISGAMIFGGGYLIPSLTLNALGFTASESGWVLLPGCLAFLLSLVLAHILIQRFKLPVLALAPLGVAAVLVSLALLALANGSSGFWELSPGVGFRAYGLGWLFLPITMSALSGLKGGLNLQAVALFSFFRQLGGSVSVAILRTKLSFYAKTAETAFASQVVGGDPLTEEKLSALERALTGEGLNSGEPSTLALAQLSKILKAKAGVWSFDEAFIGLALVILALVPGVIAYKLWLKGYFQKKASFERTV
jgi:DHA2 family multidrug resistance protein